MNTHTKYRPDIDGLRALAVLSVVIYHSFKDLMPSGFIGVDIFFVISGYLISGIIFQSLEKNNFSILDFYIRRIRRIFPALVIVLLTVLSIGIFVLLPDEISQLGKHVFAGTTFISNFILWKEDGYFDIQSDLKPLLHLWSLGVEEQFYLIWPLLLGFCWRKKISLWIPTLFILIVSYLVNYYRIHLFPVETFYLPFSRFWELMIGGLIAFTERKKYFHIENIIQNKWIQNILSIGGFYLLAYAAYEINRIGFPGEQALYPTLGAGLLILSSRSFINQYLLSFRPIAYIGLISYPLYLWHWPLLSFTRIIEAGEPTEEVKLGALLLSLLFSVMTFELLEKKIRFNTSFVKMISQKQLVWSLLSALVLIGCFGLSLQLGLLNIGNLQKYTNTFTHAEMSLEKKCKDYFPFAKQSYCSLSTDTKEPQVVIIGDSHALHFFTGLKNYYLPLQKNLVLFGKGGCPAFTGVERHESTGQPLNCREAIGSAINYAIAAKNIDTIILAGSFSSYLENNFDIDNLENNEAAKTNRFLVFEYSFHRTLKLLTSTGKKVIFMEQVPPLGFNPKICVQRPIQFNFKPNLDCLVDINFVTERIGFYRNLSSAILKEFPTVIVYDALRKFCNDQLCTAKINDELMYMDDNHLNDSGSIYLSNTFNF